MTQPRLVVHWIPQRRAKEYVAEHHRHHQPPRGAILTLGCFDATALVGVAYLGRPSAPFLGALEAEVTRVATNGTPNACSSLYGACRRVARDLGVTA